MCATLFGCIPSFLLGKYLGLELLGRRANISKVTSPFCTPTSKTRELWSVFLIFTIPMVLIYISLIANNVTSTFHVLIWPFVYLLLKCPSLLPI